MMRLKVLFIIFLCLFSASIVCNMAMTTLKAAEGYTLKAFTQAANSGFLITNRVKPMGDPLPGDPGWPN